MRGIVARISYMPWLGIVGVVDILRLLALITKLKVVDCQQLVFSFWLAGELLRF